MAEESATLLSEAIQGWRYARDGVIAEAENIPADQFGFRPTPHSRTIGELLVHIVQFGALMAGELSRAGGDFQRQSYEQFFSEYMTQYGGVTSKDDLIALLRRTVDEGAALLESAGEIALLQRIRQFDGTYATRLTWMNHGIAHEEYHRGQVALYSRILGHTPALTRLIHGS